MFLPLNSVESRALMCLSRYCKGYPLDLGHNLYCVCRVGRICGHRIVNVIDEFVHPRGSFLAPSVTEDAGMSCTEERLAAKLDCSEKALQAGRK